MTETCNKCKKLCISCKNIKDDSVIPTCLAYSKKKLDCVDGNTYTIRVACQDKNKTGNCPKWERDEEKHKREMLRKALDAYIGNYRNRNSSSNHIGTYLAIQLRLFLQDPNEEDLDFFVSFEDDKDDGDVCYKFEDHRWSKGGRSQKYRRWLQK